MKLNIKKILKTIATSAFAMSVLGITASAAWFSFSVSGIGDCEYTGAYKETNASSCSIMIDGGPSPEYPMYLATSSSNQGQGVLNSRTVTVFSNATKRYTASYLSDNAPVYGDPIYLKGWTGYYSTSLEGSWLP